MSTYKALVLESYDKPIAIQNLPTPTVTPGSILVSPIYATLFHYFREFFKGQSDFNVTLPLTPGPWAIARVEAVGEDATSIKPGDIVWSDPTISARDDDDTQILFALHAGMSPGGKKLATDIWRNGFYAQKTLMPLENAYVLPERFFKSSDEGGLGYHPRNFTTLAHMLVAYGGLEWAGVGAGATVIVAPATGKFSGGAVLTALAMGAKVIAASRSEEGLQKLYRFPGAKERLATVKLASDVEKDTAALLAATGGTGAHVFIDFSPPGAGGPSTAPHITASMNVLKRNGKTILMGGIPTNIEINYTQVLYKNLTIRGQFMYDREQVGKFLGMIENGNLKLGEEVGMSIAGVYGLEDIEKALDLVNKTGRGWGGDVLLAPNGKE